MEAWRYRLNRTRHGCLRGKWKFCFYLLGGSVIWKTLAAFLQYSIPGIAQSEDEDLPNDCRSSAVTLRQAEISSPQCFLAEIEILRGR
jgi:hypothetical protein